MPKGKSDAPVLKTVEETDVEQPKVVQRESVTVLNERGGLVRKYSREAHGENFEELAKEFTQKNKLKGYKLN